MKNLESAKTVSNPRPDHLEAKVWSPKYTGSNVNNKLCLLKGNKSFDESPPNPPLNNGSIKESHTEDELRNAEKIYISLLKQERLKDDINALEKQKTCPNPQKQSVGNTSERNNNNVQNIYKNLNSVIPSTQWCQTEPKDYRSPIRKRKGTYRKTAVNGRIRQFLNQIEEYFGIGHEFHKKELEYWITRLQLCNDRVSVKQYIKRLIQQGHFTVKTGVYTFNSKQPQQPTIKEILSIEKQLMTIRMATRKPTRRRCW